MTREGKLERAVRAARGAGRPRPLLPARPARPRPLLGAEVLGGLGVRAFGGDGRWAPGARMCTRVQTLPCAHTPGSRVKVDPKSDPVWARVPECKCSARRGARFGGWGRPCTGGVGTRGWLSHQTEDHPHDPSHCSPPFSAGGGKGRGMRAAPSDSREADFPPTGVPSPLFASRIPGGPKSLGRPLHWVLNPQPPRRREPTPRSHMACPGRSHCPPPLPQPAACAQGEKSKPGSRAPPPGTACAPPPESLGSERRSPDAGAQCGARPSRHRPARSCPGRTREAEVAGPGCAPRSARGEGEGAAWGVLRTHPEGGPGQAREWRGRFGAANEAKGIPWRDGRAGFRLRVRSSGLSAAHRLCPGCGTSQRPSALLPSRPALPRTRRLSDLADSGSHGFKGGGGGGDVTTFPDSRTWRVRVKDEATVCGLCCP